MPKKSAKNVFSILPYKKNGCCAHLICSDFDGTTTIHLQIQSSFRIASHPASSTPGSGLYSVYQTLLRERKRKAENTENALKQHFLGIGCLQEALSYECHYTPHRMPKTQNQWEPVEAELLLVFYSFHYTLSHSPTINGCSLVLTLFCTPLPLRPFLRFFFCPLNFVIFFIRN